MRKSQDNTTCKVRCLAEDVLIKMSDCTTKKIQDIRIGDEIYGFEGKPILVDDIISGHEERILEIVAGNRTIKITSNHPVKAENGIIYAKKLRPGMKVVIEDNEQVQVEMISQIMYNATVYNLYLKADTDNPNQHLMIANGFIVGDFFLQEISTTR